ncbi:hypothetical protein WMY93_026965 [Mugilogobius chulae]|uniref:C-type lectin domain-containing protein n=1 Tax=Mugilogobius chulae TaxID=88201 RepID=A0AAW0N3D3_9GOBI
MTSDSNSWRWSSTGTTNPGGYQNWGSSDPNNAGGKELCVVIVQPSGLKEYFLITLPKTWSNSQSYCRQYYHDLATIENSTENQAVTSLLPSSTSTVWIGLYRIPWRCLQMTWSDAQQYCREHYTDLATLENEEDMNKFIIPDGTLDWIGLFDDPASWKGAMTSDSNSWRWSSTGTTNPGSYQNWASVQPSGSKAYFLNTTPKTWSDSQSYCRQHYQDLATIENSAENQAVTNLLSTATTSVWIGLYCVAWRWSDGSPSTYRKWKSGEPNHGQGSESCAAQASNAWNDVVCTNKFNSVCYGAWDPEPTLQKIARVGLVTTPSACVSDE